MGTLTALLNLSQNALNASQAAIDITSNNVANANTPGYTDEVATWQETIQSCSAALWFVVRAPPSARSRSATRC